MKLLIAISMLCTISSVGFANEQCIGYVDFYGQYMQALTQLGEFKQKAEDAKTVEEANDHIYSMVVIGNVLLDVVFDTIAQQSFQPPSPVLMEKSQQAQMIVQNLKFVFGIPDLVMNQALENRRIAEHQSRVDTVNQVRRRRAIGFNRDESFLEFHGDKPAQQTPGFLGGKKIEAEPFPSVASETDSEQEGGKNPFGFVTFQDSSDSAESVSLGFEIPGLSSGEDSSLELHRVGINIRKGEFKIFTK